MSSQDKVTLSARERQELARLQSMLETADPTLAKKLARHDPTEGVRWQHIGLVAHHRLRVLAERLWVGPVLVVVGFAIMLAALSSAMWAAVGAALVVVAGLALCFSALQPRALRRSPRARAGGEEGQTQG